MKCFYHGSDLDGQCSGAIVKLKHMNCEMYPFEYGDDPPWNDFHQGETVYIVDASFSDMEMEQMMSMGLDVIWIDHHKSAIEALNELNIKGLRDTSYAACELVWKYFAPEDVMPRVVRLLGRYDVWDHSDPAVVNFQYGMRLFDLDPTCDESLQMWRLLLSDDRATESITSKGAAILLYQTRLNERLAQTYAFDLEFEGLKWIAINAPSSLGGSLILHSVYDPAKHDAMMIFQLHKDGDWLFSLRSDKKEVDVSTIAKQYGGGGHAGAAGFKRAIPPFKLKGR